jgi:mannobiose 2-epimerase
MDIKIVREYIKEVNDEVNNNILPFWIKYVRDNENGGYYGEVTNDLKIDKKAPKGCILNSRVLWTYSSAYRLFKDENYLIEADWAYKFMIKYFWDSKHGGLYWMVDYKGDALESKKQIYNIAFGIYALSEYYRVTGKEEVIERAIELYELMERHSYDSVNKGYIEALDKEWNNIEDMRLSEKDLNSQKSMNTHLHILEAYTNLLRVWNDNELRIKLYDLINIILDKIVDNNNYQFKLFFDDRWNSLSNKISYGHDIEGSWLIYEAAEVIENKELLQKAKTVSIRMAEKVYEEGIDKLNGGLFNEKHDKGILDNNKAWWPQAEAMVGFLNAYELTGEEKFIEISYDIWRFIDKHYIDKKYGEWFNETTQDGQVDNKMAKVDSWKCPYHNSRSCYEVEVRLKKLLNA